MGQLLINLTVAVAWAFFFEPFSWINLLLGYGVGAGLTWLAVRGQGRRFYLVPVWGALRLLGRLVWEQLKSAVWVTRLILDPGGRRQPGIMGVPVAVQEDWHRVAVANMITLTPGTVSVQFSPDRSQLFIHVVDLKAPDDVAASERLFERLVRGVWER
ncbi:Na+/H+ antiporter subunit E [Limnochorda pilosa]|uniref:Monovalent cation/H+ antiporter subunit E n=1 Tax=Limnochorda pilosa TaxID=1555112 RepID=A0A0K2SKP9_LIMPI|nr:Na+/H+ antiporter subunit E [Limnochorda pilosa]BAS27678.1 monovalent cation/H+ antiporter subunit E [Limnochorda pilosa]